MLAVTAVPVQLSYFIADIERAVLYFNRMRWEKSTDGEAGPFVPITDTTVRPARMVGVRLGPYDIQGKDLELKVGGVDVTISFTGGSALSAAAAATQIGSGTLLLTAADVDGFVELTTTQTGLDASIEIVGGDAAAFLGFEVGRVAMGLGADMAITGSVSEYLLTDPNSDEGYWYRVTLLNTSTSESSGPSAAFPADQIRRVPYDQTIVGYLRLCDLSGEPLPDRIVRLANVAGKNRVGDHAVFRHYKVRPTDRSGYLEVRLLRGITVDMEIDGTGFTRRIEIPETGDRVDLLDPSLVVSDEFGIQEPRIKYADRLS